jgi:hypothetical protein
LEPLAFLLLDGAPALLQVAALVETRCAVAATFFLFVEGPLSRILPQTDGIYFKKTNSFMVKAVKRAWREM